MHPTTVSNWTDHVSAERVMFNDLLKKAMDVSHRERSNGDGSTDTFAWLVIHAKNRPQRSGLIRLRRRLNQKRHVPKLHTHRDARTICSDRFRAW